jgi:hypothetical protein
MIVAGLLLILLGITVLSYEWVNYQTPSDYFKSAMG